MKLKQMNRKRISTILASWGFLAVGLTALSWAAPSVRISPPDFDFGWSPDNAKITAQFTVANTTEKLVPLLAVMPSCGCTAADFTPADIPSAKDTKIGLTFNTHGYTGVKFHKSSQVKAGQPEEEYSVVLTGVVADPNALVVPEGSGVVEFSTSTRDKEQTVAILNKTGKDLTVKRVQAPADWVGVKLESENIEQGKKGLISVKLNAKVEGDRNTSATFEATDSSGTYRFTVAFRTGQGPEPYKKIRPVAPASSAVAKPSAAPVKPKKSNPKKPNNSN